MTDKTEQKKWNVVTSEYKLKTPYINVRFDRCKSLRGNDVDYYVVERADAVGIVAFTPNKKVIMQRQYRHPVGEWVYEVPAGMIEKGENLKKAIKRELLEETGYTVESVKPFPSFFPSAGVLAQRFTMYIGFNAKKVQDPLLEKSEDLETLLVDFDELIKMIETGEIGDGETIAGVFLAKQYLEKHGWGA